MSSRSSKLLWIDCEMTGLNPYLRPADLDADQPFVPDRILEIACIATNADLEYLDDGVQFIVKTDRSVLDSMNEWCIHQHAKTGLTESCLKAPLTMADVDVLCTSYVRQHWPEAGAILAGSSVHADRAFIKKDLPGLASLLHYRIVDVSSIKELVARWYLDAEHTLSSAVAPKLKHESLHRAMSDIRDSVNELRYYRRQFFVDGRVER